MPDTQRIHSFNIKFARMVLEQKLATQEQVSECLSLKQDGAKAGKAQRQLPDIMVDKGYLARESAEAIRKQLERQAFPEEIASYEIKSVVGRGGMGIVYRARAKRTGEPIALKVVRLSALNTATARTRFEREARLLQRLSHPNIVGCIEIGEWKGSQFIAMEFVEGEPVNKIVKESGPLSIEKAVDIAASVADALAYAHSKHMIHRDIKPNNILVDPDGTVKLLDFGLSKSQQDEYADLTMPGTGMGTPYYMPPEQIRGAKTVDHRGDIYSLGATLYEAVTGQRTLEGKPMEALMKLESGEPITPPEELRPDLPPEFCRILKKMLARDQDDRYQSAGRLLRELQELRAALTGEPPPIPAKGATGKSYCVRFRRPDGSILTKQYAATEVVQRIVSNRFKPSTLCRVGKSGKFVRLDSLAEFADVLHSRKETVVIKSAVARAAAGSPKTKVRRVKRVSSKNVVSRHPLLFSAGLIVLAGAVVVALLMALGKL